MNSKWDKFTFGINQMRMVGKDDDSSYIYCHNGNDSMPVVPLVPCNMLSIISLHAKSVAIGVYETLERSLLVTIMIVYYFKWLKKNRRKVPLCIYCTILCLFRYF